MYKHLFIALSLCGFASYSFAGNIQAGQALATAQCAACHATNGNWNQPASPTYPKLAGQHQDYLMKVLKHYQNGTRNNAIMSGVAANLSSQQIQDLSTFFASLDGDLHLKK